MALASGARLGAYEILSPLGSGGMGEVYRARDLKLKREVALKVLPAEVANDRERLARFQREAEVLAALNHPNIAQIHGIEESNGTTALVMELVARFRCACLESCRCSGCRRLRERHRCLHQRVFARGRYNNRLPSVSVSQWPVDRELV